MNYDQETCEFVRAQEERVASLNARLHSEGEGRIRPNEYERDYTRVIYSSYFRRLQGKMQLLGVDHTQSFRNRLTHSLEVAQIARGLSNEMGMSSSYVAETAALSHDLGNPPFGHAGERVLHDIARSAGIDGFEGNAQTFRILHRLEKKHYAFRGLNLTARTLLAVVKYYKRFDPDRRRFLYTDDYGVVSGILERHDLGREPVTIDMQIMDLADEIAYAAHDMEDCLSLKYFTIDELLYEFKRHPEFSCVYEELKTIVEKCQGFAEGAHFFGSEEFSYLFRKELTSNVVHRLMRDVAYLPHQRRLGFRTLEPLAEGLKILTFQAIKRRPSVQLYEKQGEQVIRGLYQVYTDARFNVRSELLPPEYRSTDVPLARNVLDFLSGMMDSFALQQYEQFFGAGRLSGLYHPAA